MGNCNGNTGASQRMRRIERTLAMLVGSMTGGGRALQVQRYGSDYQQTGSDPCGAGPRYCPPSLLSADTEAAIKAGPRIQTVLIPLPVLAAGASVSTTIASNGLERTLGLADLIATLTGAGQTLDSLHVVVTVSGIVKLDFFGGRFSRANANACTTSCGLAVCLGPIEAAVITVTNVSAVATGAADSAQLQVASIYRGEPGFVCAPCVPAGVYPSPLPPPWGPFPGQWDLPAGANP